MEPPQTKGTVTPLASLFSEEEARKAASYVEERIREKREEMNRLQRFVDENDNLISLVKKLPEKLHHNIMVPFGKIAFFPGRLVHTNECLVFLGENYYTDRTSKQTVDVLRRRDKTLQSQIHSLKAEIDDFQTEASFFANTASEAAEGVLEIREEYEEEDSGTVCQRGVEKEASGVSGGEAGEGEDKDDEFARIMSRLNELEMEEEQEDGEDGDDRSEEHDVEERDLDVVKGLGDKTGDNGIGYEESVLEKPQYLQKEDKSRGGIPQQNAETWRDFQATSRGKASSSVVGPQKIESPIQKQEPKFDTNKAFTGSIVEHTHNLETNTHGKMQPSGSQPSKPVSRFKAQRR
ncbi:hypothetical protein BRARA_J00206 [Brassica rapa]|uniref:Uncharacterized protein n=1 Tax=Brassica campestris TaxID=3711 RepID=A0A397XHQ1_BRACM|nr:RNA polymerase II subunit 5-mediating protein homolog [Brassica napus]RID40141.1 hypothetical protein BRARA_J00206 [Brassica rapa]